MNEVRLKIWNIHGAASMGWNNDYEIKKNFVNEILEKEPHIIILLEFVVAKGWDYFQQKLKDKKYIWFMSYTSYKNGIVIAIRRDIDGLNLEQLIDYRTNCIINDIATPIKEKPDFLQVTLKINENTLAIIGTRIRVCIDKNATEEQKNQFKKDQFRALDEYLSNIEIDNVICAGDFNAYWGMGWKNESNHTLPITKNTYELRTPKWNIKNRLFSYVLKNNKLVSFDHIIFRSKKNTIEIEESNVNYDWKFVNEGNGYENLKPDDYKSCLNGCPDHAILTATIKM